MTDIYLPRLGATMEEGQIVRWLVAVGDEVREGEPLLELETDKVTAVVDSPASGRLSEIVEEGGRLVRVGTVIARLAEPT